MPYEIFALPALICFIIGFVRGLKHLYEPEDEIVN